MEDEECSKKSAFVQLLGLGLTDVNLIDVNSVSSMTDTEIDKIQRMDTVKYLINNNNEI